jgi:hypothetical protein
VIVEARKPSCAASEKSVRTTSRVCDTSISLMLEFGCSEDGLRWVQPSLDGNGKAVVPCWSVAVGTASEYVGRMKHAGSILIGRIVLMGVRLVMFTSYAGNTLRTTFPDEPSIQVLVNPENRARIAWSECRDNLIPVGAIPAGWVASTCEACYIVRSLKQRYTRVGWVNEFEPTLHIEFGGAAMKQSDFEVLVALPT